MDRDPLYRRAYAALGDLAQEISLEDILQRLRAFYRAALDEEATDACPPYQQICQTALGALDRALWYLESTQVCEEGD